MINESETIEQKPNSAAEGTRPKYKPLGVRSNDRFNQGSSMKSTALGTNNAYSTAKNRLTGPGLGRQ